MKAIFFAAAAALGLGIGTAYANERAGQASGYVYPDYTAPAAAVPSLGIGSAYANERAGQASGYVYPDYTAPGAVVAGAPASVQKSLPVATVQTGKTIHAYVAHSQNLGTWLWPPSMHRDGGNN